MSSIDSAQIVRTILKNNGQYPGDPPCYSVWKYENAWGGVTYKLCMSQKLESSFIENGMYSGTPEALFRNNEVTMAGNQLLSSN